MCFDVNILSLVFFDVKKIEISASLMSPENGADVNKMTNITYGLM